MKNKLKLIRHLKQNITNIAYCWLIVRQDQQQFAFTNHDRDIIFNDVKYKSNIELYNSNIERRENLQFSNFEINYIINSNEILEDDLKNGKFENADMKLFMVN